MTAWHKGYLAGAAGAKSADNPCRPGTADYDWWLRGWLDHATELVTHGPIRSIYNDSH